MFDAQNINPKIESIKSSLKHGKFYIFKEDVNETKIN